MDENNTTPPPNLPDDGDNNKPKESMFGKNHNPYIENNYKNTKDWHAHSGNHTTVNKPVPVASVYDEIVEDLIDIIAKLLKELSKRK